MKKSRIKTTTAVDYAITVESEKDKISYEVSAMGVNGSINEIKIRMKDSDNSRSYFEGENCLRIKSFGDALEIANAIQDMFDELCTAHEDK